MKRVWLVIGSLVTLATIGWGTYSAVALMAHQRTRTPVRFAGITTVRIVNETGGMRLVAADTTEVSGIRVVNEGLRAPTVTERVDGATLVLTASCPLVAGPHCSAEWELTVPRLATLDLDTSAGRIVIDVLPGAGAAGPIHALSSAGSVRVSGAAGRVFARSEAGGVSVLESTSDDIDASSAAGAVRVELVEPAWTVRADSSAGDVTVIVPNDGTAYFVEVSASAGSSDVGVPTDPGSSRRISAVSSAGDARVDHIG